MAYKIKYYGYDVTCDTVADLRALVDQNGAKPPKPPAQSSKDETATVVARLIAKIEPDQRELLRCIATAGTVTRDVLRQKIGVADTRQFAGLLISISKSASGIGIESPIEKVATRTNGRGPRVYQYKIRNSVKAETKEALSKF